MKFPLLFFVNLVFVMITMIVIEIITIVIMIMIIPSDLLVVIMIMVEGLPSPLHLGSNLQNHHSVDDQMNKLQNCIAYPIQHIMLLYISFHRNCLIMMIMMMMMMIIMIIPAQGCHPARKQHSPTWSGQDSPLLGPG